MKTRTTLNLDDESLEAMGNLPRRISASQLTRWALKLAAANEKEFRRLMNSDAEFREVQDYVRPRMMRALGISEEQRKKLMKMICHEEPKL